MSHARKIAESLGGKWVRGKSVVCCPAHPDKTPSMSVGETRDGRALVCCHANCTQEAVIDALRKRGLWDGEAKGDPSYPGYLTKPHEGNSSKDERDRREYARDLWDRSDRIGGTLAERYLRGRKISMPIWPDDLGYLPRLDHNPSGKSYPAMIAAIRDDTGRIAAVQRTWLDPQGVGKADVQPSKMTVGPMGASAVRLGKPSTYMGLAEGVETALSASIIYGIPVWATLSANRLDKIIMPKECESLVIFADRGRVGMDAASEAAVHYEGLGLAVDVMPPSVHFGAADDFNSALQARNG